MKQILTFTDPLTLSISLFCGILGFKPYYADNEDISRLLQHYSKDLRDGSVGHLVFSGGNTKLKGFESRIKRDCYPTLDGLHVHSPPNREMSPWVRTVYLFFSFNIANNQSRFTELHRDAIYQIEGFSIAII